MLDFLMISTRSPKRGHIEIYPKFIIKKSSDLMIRGGDFYAIWIDGKGLWSTDEQDALQLIDAELDAYARDNKNKFNDNVKILHMWDAESGMIDSWHKYCQKQLRDSFHPLDENLIFANTETKKTDYASKRLPYPLEPGDFSSYDKLVATLYSEEERRKIEWAIGSIVNGDSKKIQKFLVLYGAAGTGKSTILNIIQQLFEGYYSVFDARALGSTSNSFALEAFKSNPLVAIQHDGDLSRIEDNTRLNSLVSHELMTVNEKFKSTYSNRFNCFLFMGTNKPVKITDAKSGLIRRLIDVSPTGDKVSQREYKSLTKKISFELGAIAKHCQEVYLDDPNFYDSYIPITMLGASNDFFNYVLDSYMVFKSEDGTTLKSAWEMYKAYCEDAKVQYQYPQRVFKEELKNYFYDYKERYSLEDGTRVRSYYSGFITDKFEDQKKEPEKETNRSSPLIFDGKRSAFDDECASCPAQYGTSNEVPKNKWDDVKTILSDIDTSKLHYVKVPENHIVIDFDIPDKDGNKCLEKNIEEASKWPPTYAELSKSGKGVHLHYIYTGDPSKLSRVYDDHIEIKVFNGKSSLRRKLSKCNSLHIASISSGLPMKGEKMVNFDGVKSEKGLRTTIKKCLSKEIHPGTKPCIDFIYKILEDAHNSSLNYDVTDMRPAVLAFAAGSTHQADYCIKLVNKMQFKSDDISENVESSNKTLVFYDVEVFPNLFLVNWKLEGPNKPVIRMINPTPAEIESLLRYRLVGFNCRRYDNHILYARLIGYTNEQLFNLSSRIVKGSENCFFGEAYNISYTDVYDFSSTKQSLKKFEIELGIHHQELGLPWDQPVPEELWTKVAEYCDNDVIATEAVFNARKADFTARKILADVAGMTVNDTTNSLTTRIIFGKNRKPQSEFNYRDLSKPVRPSDDIFDRYGRDREYRLFDESGTPVFETYRIGTDIPDGWSIMPFFPKYVYERGKSYYILADGMSRDDILDKYDSWKDAIDDGAVELIGEGGRVFSIPGCYGDVWDGDIMSQHPHSAWEERVFGPNYTQRFKDLIDIRIAIKHKDFDRARKMLGGALEKYLTDEETASELAQALKIAINSVYGLTSASFENPFRDPRNYDNIVAKRGALFMTKLKEECLKRGIKVCHIKTDSIKIPDATPEQMDFVISMGHEYGYTFETEAVFDRFCIVNDAVYVAKFKGGKNDHKWTATGTQFQVPYVFKTLFSHEPIEFDDMCETKAVSTALYLDMNEGLEDTSLYEKELTRLEKNSSNTERQEELRKIISKNHKYHFVGKVGRFCPMKDGYGAGVLLRESSNGYAAATGSKGYRWMESEMVQNLEKQDGIDKRYYQKMVDDAVDTINLYCDIDWFVSDATYDKYDNGILPF